MADLRVVRADVWLHPAFEERLAAEPGITVGTFAARGDAAAAWRVLQGAHVYQISAAKDELPRQFWAGADFLARCPHLLCVSSSGAGYDTVDVAACTAAGVAVVNQAGGNADSVAEHTMGLLLGVSHRMVECDRRMRRDFHFPREQVMGHEIRGRTMGVVGIGNTGMRVAKLARAFGMEVIATDPFVPAREIAQRGARAVTMEELLSQADVVSLHCPRDASTQRMMDAAAFARMKRGAIFITTSRGGIHDEQALAQALQSGHLGGAGLDVWDPEPPPLDHPLLQLPNVFATFHTAGVTQEARRNIAVIGAEQVAGMARGERPPRLINPQVWRQVRERLARRR